MALLTGLLVVQLGLVVLARQREVQLRLTERAEALAAVRIVRDLVAGELHRGRPGRDWVADAGDSVGLRSFRGLGGVCPSRPSSTEILVAYEGIRAPAPSKDSVLLMDERGRWAARSLEAAGPARDGCPAAPGVAVQRWRLDRDPPVGVVLARVFEHGSYHLSGQALRYRRGAAGRQPLTPEVLLTPPSRFIRDSTGVEVVLSVSGSEGGPARWWRQTLWRRSTDDPSW